MCSGNTGHRDHQVARNSFLATFSVQQDGAGMSGFYPLEGGRQEGSISPKLPSFPPKTRSLIAASKRFWSRLHENWHKDTSKSETFLGILSQTPYTMCTSVVGSLHFKTLPPQKWFFLDRTLNVPRIWPHLQIWHPANTLALHEMVYWTNRNSNFPLCMQPLMSFDIFKHPCTLYTPSIKWGWWLV